MCHLAVGQVQFDQMREAVAEEGGIVHLANAVAAEVEHEHVGRDVVGDGGEIEVAAVRGGQSVLPLAFAGLWAIERGGWEKESGKWENERRESGRPSRHDLKSAKNRQMSSLFPCTQF